MLIVVLLLCCSVSPAFAVSESINSDFVIKDIDTGDITYIKASDLPVTHSTETSMPAYEGAESTLSVMPMDIIGGDNRSKIADTTQFPYRAIGYIEFVAKW